jgi:hypothetical protein
MCVSLSRSSHNNTLRLLLTALTTVRATYDSVFGVCIALKTHGGLVGAVAVLTTDTMLFMMMLIGLLRHAHGSSIGIWHLLYKQVTPNPFHDRSPQALKTLSVHHLDDLGGGRGDTTGGL